ncbi:hypothetical protein F5B19DRAFT_369262 [Rostrohypoxylon terebratum]|nr:hypothetical protein F5B19DRAFT_369262 [Rostrohypoxylon terebratum]
MSHIIQEHPRVGMKYNHFHYQKESLYTIHTPLPAIHIPSQKKNVYLITSPYNSNNHRDHCIQAKPLSPQMLSFFHHQPTSQPVNYQLRYMENLNPLRDTANLPFCLLLLRLQDHGFGRTGIDGGVAELDVPLAFADALVVFPRVDTLHVRFEEVGEASVPVEGVVRRVHAEAGVEGRMTLFLVACRGVDVLRSASSDSGGPSVGPSDGWVRGEEAFRNRRGDGRGWGGVGGIIRRGCGKCHSFSLIIGRSSRVGITGDIPRSLGIVIFRGLHVV